jgi:hypothetical protein
MQPHSEVLVRPDGIRQHKRRQLWLLLKLVQIRTHKTWMGPLRCIAPFEHVARLRYVLCSTTGEPGDPQ